MAQQGDRLSDGLGNRRVVEDPALGVVEVLDLGAAVAGCPGAEGLIEGRAARMAATGVTPTVHRVERHGATLRVITERPNGVRLSDLLREMAAAPAAATCETTVSIARALAHAVSAIHQQPGGLWHGAICPEHIVVTPDGAVVLTDAVYGSVLERLHVGRDQLWARFGLALPWGAGPARLDQRTDLAQMAAVILALALGRPLSGEEYARRLPELVASALAASGPSSFGMVSDLRSWLQRSLQLPSLEMFASGVDAERSLLGFVHEAEQAAAPMPAVAAAL